MSKTKEEIHQEMLDDISNDHDKMEGSLIYDATKPAARQFETVYKEVENVKGKLSIENLKGDELEQRVYEKTGQTRRLATYSTTTVIVNGTAGTKTIIGDNVSTDTIAFIFQEEKTLDSNGQAFLLVKCEVAGSIGNVPANTITQFPVTLQGITSVTNPNPVIDGYEAESDDELRQRYYEIIQTPATSGNKAHYRNWAKEVPGVGDVKVFPRWNGDNTVKVLIIDANKLPAPQSLVDAVQDYIDPGTTGLGEGQAPIGAFCTVASAMPFTIDVSCTATKDPAYTDEQRQESVEENIRLYFASVAFVDSQVSYAKAGALILDSNGIQDYTDLLLDGVAANIPIGDEEVPVLGVVTIA